MEIKITDICKVFLFNMCINFYQKMENISNLGHLNFLRALASFVKVQHMTRFPRSGHIYQKLK